MYEDLEDIRDDVDALIADPDPQRSAELLDREMAIYVTLPEEKRLVVEERLSALAAMPGGGRTVFDVDAAATRLKVGRSNIYRLLKRVEDLGPVSGLVPGKLASERASMARGGFGEPVDGWIEEMLRERPDVTIAEIQRMVTTRLKALPQVLPDGGMRRNPTESALKRRINELRQRGIRAGREGVLVGKSLVIDYGLLNAAVTMDLGQPHGDLAKAVLIMDGGTSLVLGAGLFLRDDVAGGLGRAMLSLRSPGFLPRENTSFAMAARPHHIRWVVSPDLTGVALEVLNVAKAVEPAVQMDIDWAGTAGRDIYRHIGRTVGRFTFRMRASPRSMAHHLLEDFALTSLEQATTAFEWELIQRNKRVIDAADVRQDAVSEQDRGAGAAAWLEYVEALFAPVLKPADHDRGDAGYWSASTEWPDRSAG